jgi:hypothetical protein
MQILNSLYPYPVLSIGDEDYNEGARFTVDYEFIEATAFKSARVIATFTLEEPDLELLVSAHKAAFFLHVESARTAYRKLFPVENGKVEVEIDTELMRSSVELTGLLLNTQVLDGFMSLGINADLYGEGYAFPKLEVGNPLAVAYTRVVDIPEVDDLSQVSSVIKVGTTKEEYMSVDYDQDIIFVRLPQKEYESYVSYGRIFGEVMLSSIIMPALIFVLDAVANNPGDDMVDRTWYKAIAATLDSFGYSVDDLVREELTTVEAAQRILKSPLKRLFLEVSEVVDTDE